MSSPSSHTKTLWIEARQTLHLALPIAASQVGQLLLGMIDTIMIGRLGVAPLGASAFAVSIFSVILVFGFGVSSCLSPLVARADGAQKKRECGEVLRHGIFFMLICGVLLASILQALSKFLSIFGQTQEVISLSRDYLVVMGWSIVPALLFAAVRQFSEGLSKAYFPMIVMVLAVGLNTGLNWLWIYGNWGFSAYGLSGAAWATFFTRVAMLIALVMYVIRSPKFEEYLPLKWTAKFSANWFREMFRLGVPSALQTFFEVGAFAGAAVMMGWISTTALAAHQVAISVASMTFMVTLGLSFATSIRVSNAVGRSDLEGARRVGFVGIGLGGLAMSIFSVLIFATYHWLPKIYTSDLQVIDLAAQLLIVGAFFQVFDGIQGVAIGALRGLRDVVMPTMITAVAYWIVSLPAVYFLAFVLHQGAVGIWIGLSIGLVVAATALSLRFHLTTMRSACTP